MPPVNKDIVAAVTITLDTGGHGTKFVTVCHCKDEAVAKRISDRSQTTPVFALTKTRNGLFVLMCNFSPPDPKKATEVEAVFRSYKP